VFNGVRVSLLSVLSVECWVWLVCWELGVGCVGSWMLGVLGVGCWVCWELNVGCVERVQCVGDGCLECVGCVGCWVS